ncbi:MAG: hypothetical protein N2C14_11495, partial [Planctomycetales bacterium]
IRARLGGEFRPPPEELKPHNGDLQHHNDELALEAHGDLAQLFGWLGTLPLEEVRVEPVGLKAVYERFHPDREPTESQES